MSDMSNFNKVKTFMNTYGQDVKEKAEFPENKIVQLRIDLIEEELNELKEAIKNKDIVEVADALGDMLYILCGTIIEHGMQDKIEEIFDEIQKSNLSKLGDDGKPIYRNDGKVMKGPNYFKPKISEILN